MHSGGAMQPKISNSKRKKKEKNGRRWVANKERAEQRTYPGADLFLICLLVESRACIDSAPVDIFRWMDGWIDHIERCITFLDCILFSPSITSSRTVQKPRHLIPQSWFKSSLAMYTSTAAKKKKKNSSKKTKFFFQVDCTGSKQNHELIRRPVEFDGHTLSLIRRQRNIYKIDSFWQQQQNSVI